MQEVLGTVVGIVVGIVGGIVVGSFLPQLGRAAGTNQDGPDGSDTSDAQRLPAVS